MESVSSPEGVYVYNRKLSARRAASMLDYLYRKHSQFTLKIYSSQKAESWDLLEAYIEQDTKLPTADKESLLMLLRSKESVQLKKSRLSAHRHYSYLYKSYYHHLRRSSVKIYRAEYPAKDSMRMAQVPNPQKVTCCISDTSAPATAVGGADDHAAAPQKSEDASDDDAVGEPEDPVVEVAEKRASESFAERRIPVFAFRTNLLVPAMNAGIEVPIRSRWSVGGD